MQKVLVLGISPVQIHDIGDRNAVLISFEQIYRVASIDFPLFSNRKVEPSPTALQKPLHDIWAVKANAEFEARHSRLSDNKFGRADAKAVADVNRFLKQTRRCKVFTESSPRKVYARKFLAPEGVMFRWIGLNSLIDSSMDGKVRLPIPF
jgi:hypothetical protein